MKYSVIIPTYNRFDLIKKCVDSILKYSSDLLKSEMEVIIVSNGCKDGTPLYLETLATHNKAFKYIVWEESLGYSKAINLGLTVAKGEYIILLNNDAQVLESDWIDILEEPFKKYKNVGITGPAGLERSNVPWLIFFCVMIKKEVFNTVGLLNEAYGIGGGEDTEFCIKAYQAGYTNYMVPLFSGNFLYKERKRFFPVYHEGGATTNSIPDMSVTTARNNERLTQLFGPT